MNRERLLKHLEDHYIPKREMISRIPLGVQPDDNVATALLYGIKTDTLQFSRGVRDEDISAFAYLNPLIDDQKLTTLEMNNIEFSDLQSYGAAINNIQVFQYLGNGVLHKIHSHRVRLKNHCAVVVIDHQARQPVALAVNKAEHVGVGAVEKAHTAAEFDGVGNLLAEKYCVRYLIFKG